MKQEMIILTNLLKNESYCRRVMPFLKDEYFQDKEDKHIFTQIKNFITKYNNIPSYEAIIISIKESDISENDMSSVQKMISLIKATDKENNEAWLINMTEKWCQEQAIYNALYESIKITEGKSGASKQGIPELLSKALAVSFDNSVGHDFIDDYDKRYEFYHRTENHIPVGNEYFDKITNGGFSPKTLNIFIGSIGAGKSLFMSHFASCYLKQNKNVLYITCELSEEQVAKRIDANVLDIDMNHIKNIPNDVYANKIHHFQKMHTGKLIIKEYPTATASVNHFRHLLNELNLKRKFVPDVILVDYLNICTSSRIKPGGASNSYQIVKSVAEELRGLAVERNVPIITATQYTRQGMTSTDVGMENTSESIGIAQTADFMAAIIKTDDLTQLNQLLIKQLKNRYRDENIDQRFVVGVDKTRMRIVDLDITQQQNITNIAPSPTTLTKFLGSKFQSLTV